LTAPEEVDGLANIGPKIKSKMKEFLSTGRIKKVEKLTENEEFPILEMFKEIHGVGPETAKLLFSKGIKTIAALRENQGLLSAVQKVPSNSFI
jgi:DNA polymerase/3'-5' exonuclease PolX